MPEEIREQKGKLIVEFAHFGNGLAVHGDALQGFAIAGKDGRYFRAEAQVKGDRVEVWSDSVEHPTSVCYAWADNPATANLYNVGCLPASPLQAHIVARQ